MTKYGSFTCWKCEETFPKEWSNEEAEAEYTGIFGQYLGEEREVLCDDCHTQFMAWFNQKPKGSIGN